MLSKSMRESMEQATANYQGHVDQVGEYLAERGIDPETADTFRLGYVAEPEVGDEICQGRLAIPYLTPVGPIDVRFRTLDGSDPKYYTRIGSASHMYNVLAFGVDSEVIAITEGEIDTIVMHGLCGVPSIGIPGASNWKARWGRAFVDYPHVYVMADGDKAGRDFARKVVASIDQAVVVAMPPDMDVNEFYLDNGPDGVRKRMGIA